MSAAGIAVVAGVTVAAFVTLGDDDGGDDDGGSNTIDVPAASRGQLPESVEEVRLVGLDDGEDRRLGELLGEAPIVLNFFASWCVPCIEEMPDFQRVHQDLRDQVRFLGLAAQDTQDDAIALVEQTGVTYPTYADPVADALSFFEATAMPTTVFLAPDGEILEVHSRPLDESGLRDKINEHFELGGVAQDSAAP